MNTTKHAERIERLRASLAFEENILARRLAADASVRAKHGDVEADRLIRFAEGCIKRAKTCLAKAESAS